VTFTNELPDSVSSGVWVSGAGDAQMSQFIARTMDENIQSVSDGFENQTNVVKVGLNATEGLNLQKIGDDATSDNRQRLAEAGAADNLQKIDDSAMSVNRQQLDGSATSANRQTLANDVVAINRQAVIATAVEAHREVITSEVRAQNIHEVVEAVHHRLDRFETDHFGFLQIGRTHKFTDAFVLLEDDDSEMNRQLVDGSYSRMGLGNLFKANTNQNQSDSLQSTAEPLPQTLDRFEVDSVLEPSAHVEQSVTRGVASQQFSGLRLFRGKADLHARGFSYVQWLVAAVTIAFAAPIASHADYKRTASGPLIAVPVLLPVLDDTYIDETHELRDLKLGAP
jgi:hypothetical protein